MNAEAVIGLVCEATQKSASATHRFAGGDVGEAGRLDGAHFVPVRHQHHGAGHPALVNERLQRRCESPAARN